ncbi:MAG TPA: hypothetical protein VIX37_25070 [Candidatus Sulfotelmatobacter sp.]
MTVCLECGVTFGIGDWPFCPHQSVLPERAKHFDSIVVWQSNSDSEKYSFPGQANEPVPEGYHKCELNDLRSADKFIARMNAIERRKLEAERDQRYALDDAGIRERRRNEDASGAVNARAEALRRRVREWTDKVRERRREAHPRIDPNFHINVLSFDSGNRNSYSGPETGWRERKS